MEVQRNHHQYVHLDLIQKRWAREEQEERIQAKDG